jgi:SAM-dependent methyltransferase
MACDPKDVRSPIVSWYETQRGEPDRLLSGRGRLEGARTKELIARHLPAGSLSILDVGGGAGYYASWLAGLGHRVVLLDSVPLHVDRARIEAGEPPAFQAQVGDARELPFNDGAFDAVLLLGPLYHLLELQDRLLALREARRVSKRGGSVFAAAISRYALPGDGIRNGWIDGEEKERSVEHVIAHGLTAELDQGWFLTMCYCHRADELRAELGSAELAVEAVYGIEGPAFLVADIDEKWADPATRESLLWAARLVEREPGLQEISGHLLAVART